MTFTDAEWFERAEQLRTGAATLQGMAADDSLPINAAARDTLRGVASILLSEAKRVTRIERVTP